MPRLELFKEMVPTVKRVAVFSDPLTIDQLRAVEAANTRIHFRLQPLELRHSPYDFRSAFSIAMRSHAEALFVDRTCVCGSLAAGPCEACGAPMAERKDKRA